MMSIETVSIRKLSSALGAEVRGVELASGLNSV
jgi:hypothetical protein